MIALVCGLSLDRPNSFARQLRALARALRAQGKRVLVVGRAAGEGRRRIGSGEWELAPLAGAGLAGLRRLSEPLEAAVLLGYPDQFPLLREPEPPCPLYFWAQCSRPPDPRAYGPATVVPLTETTRVFLVSAGVDRVGPVIPHGVDLEVFRPAGASGREPAPRRSSGASFVIGTVGANTHRKRFDTLLAGFALFARGRGGARLRIKTDRERAPGGFDLPGLCDRLGVGRMVRLETRELSDSGMAGFHQALSLFLTASEWEGFGLPVVEAMACGRPVMSLPIQGAAETVPYSDLLVPGAELVRDGATVLRRSAPQELAGALLRASAAPGLLGALGLRGRDEAAERYDIRRVARSWRELIDPR